MVINAALVQRQLAFTSLGRRVGRPARLPECRRHKYAMVNTTNSNEHKSPRRAGDSPVPRNADTVNVTASYSHNDEYLRIPHNDYECTSPRRGQAAHSASQECDRNHNGGWRGCGDVQNALNNAGFKTFCRLYMVVYFTTIPSQPYHRRSQVLYL